MNDRPDRLRWTPVGSPRLTDEEGQMRERMSSLAESMPCLSGKPGVRPWDPDRLDRWAHVEGLTASELHAARFVLHVWDGKRPWQSGRFDFLDALDHWDEEHRAGFGAWVLDPWWPLSLAARPFRREEPPEDTLPTGDDPESLSRRRPSGP